MGGFSPGVYINKTRFGHFFVDGSHLLKQIEKLQTTDSSLKGKKLNIGKFTADLCSNWGNETDRMVRVIFYFKKNDPRIDQSCPSCLISRPESINPLNKGYYQIIECGFSNLTEQGSEDKKEKGVDIRIACDALTLAVIGVEKKFFFLTDDADFYPLFEALQKFGANVYLTGIREGNKVNNHLLKLVDGFRSCPNFIVNNLE